MNNYQHSPASDDEDDFIRKMDAIKASFAAKLPGNIDEIEQTLASLRLDHESENTETGLNLMINVSHRLAGSGGTFGFSDISEKSALIEKKCEVIRRHDTAFTMDNIEELNELVKALKASVQTAISASP